MVPLNIDVIKIHSSRIYLHSSKMRFLFVLANEFNNHRNQWLLRRRAGAVMASPISRLRSFHERFSKWPLNILIISDLSGESHNNAMGMLKLKAFAS